MTDFDPDPGESDPDEFDFESFRNVVRSHWTYLSKGNISNWAFSKRDDGVWQVGAAPVFQEVYGGTDDGKRVWCPFDFNIGGFIVEPDVEVDECGVSSFEEATNTRPFILFVGTYKQQPFALQLHLEPIPDTEPWEILDTIKDEVRPINGEIS